MKTGKKAVSVIVTLAAVFTFTITGSVLLAEDLPALQGITVKDEHPNGCIDCHVKVDEERDYRLNIEVKKFEKKHPPIDKMVKKVPDDCLKCHKEGSKSGALGEKVHKDHFSNPKENVFVANYNGDCLNCHTLDLNTGVMSFKSGAANW